MIDPGFCFIEQTVLGGTKCQVSGLSSQPRITYINTKPRTPSTSHVPQQRNSPTDEVNQKRGHSERAPDEHCSPDDNPGSTPSKQRNRKMHLEVMDFVAICKAMLDVSNLIPD
ncbi:hypothetical protein TSMEX_005368 [Taenia solium]|eukprot:TsM_000820300 transcript=TsM_000820300 gene=TsM_000820300